MRSGSAFLHPRTGDDPLGKQAFITQQLIGRQAGLRRQLNIFALRFHPCGAEQSDQCRACLHALQRTSMHLLHHPAGGSGGEDERIGWRDHRSR